MNNGQFAGYLGRDAELKSTPSGTSVLNFSVAVTIGFGDKKKTLWVDCAIWGERAEKLEQYLTKGKPVAVSGDIDFRLWESREGKHGGSLMCNVQRVTFMSGKDDDKHAPADKPAETTGGDKDFDDDIPF